jgi:hypothetical protein
MSNLLIINEFTLLFGLKGITGNEDRGVKANKI